MSITLDADGPIRMFGKLFSLPALRGYKVIQVMVVVAAKKKVQITVKGKVFIAEIPLYFIIAEVTAND